MFTGEYYEGKRTVLLLVILLTLFSLTSFAFASVDITPENPDTGDDLTCFLDGEHPSTYRYEWRRDGSLYSGSLSREYRFPDSLTEKDMDVSCSVFGPFSLFLGMGTVTIENSDPIVRSKSPSSSTVSLDEGGRQEFGVEVYDPDEDRLYYVWELDGRTVQASYGDGEYDFSARDDGLHTMQVIISDGDGGETSAAWLVGVEDSDPEGSIFTPRGRSYDEGEDIVFLAQDLEGIPTDNVRNLTWDFRDGNVNECRNICDNVTHYFSEQGRYSVVLNIFDEDSSSVDAHTVFISDVDPSGEIVGDRIRAEEGEVVSFSSRNVESGADHPDADPVNVLEWDFNDGSRTSFGESVEHVFENNGTYEVSLDIWDEDSFTTDTIDVIISDVDPEFSIVVDDEEIYEGQTVEFSLEDTSDTISSVQWTFGDGENATGETVVHRYVDNGTFMISARVFDEDSFTFETLTIDVLDLNPLANFTINKTPSFEGNLVSFNGTFSKGNEFDEITRYEWQLDGFGIAEEIIGDEEVINYTFNNNGTYEACLRVYDEDSHDELCQDLEILDFDPSGSFNISYPRVEGTNIYFDVSNVTGGPDEIVSIGIDFGDGISFTLDEGELESVGHIYQDNGTYEVVLDIVDEDSSYTAVMNLTVEDFVARANASVNVSSIIEGETVYFEPVDIVNSSYDSISGFEWYFGDGDFDSGEVVSHRYVDNGSFNVTLVVYDEDSVSFNNVSIDVGDVDPVLSLDSDVVSLVEGENITFSYSANGSDVDELSRYEFDFGDGWVITMVSERFPPEFIVNLSFDFVYSYLDNGTYTVVVNQWDEDSFSTINMTINVSDSSPVANFSIDNYNPLADEIISFTDLTEPNRRVTLFEALDTEIDVPFDYVWYFGDGENSTEQNPTHSYDENGYYNVTFIVIDDDGSRVNMTQQVVVGELGVAPVVEIVSPEDEANFSRFSDVLFNGTAVDNIDGVLNESISWYSDINGFLSTGSTFTTNVLRTGIHTITLSAEDSEGNQANASILVNITGDEGRLINTTLDEVYYEDESTELINDVNGSIVRDSTLDEISISSSEVNSSVLVNVEVNDSTILNSDLENCIVINSYVKDIVASDCVFIDSFVDPSNLTGSNISGGSRIIASNVTYSDVNVSNITDSDVEFSEVNNSVINVSDIDTCSLVDSDVEGLVGSGCDVNSSEIFNSTLVDSDVNDSIVNDSVVNSSSLDNSTIVDSNLTDSDLVNSTVSNSSFVDADVNGSDVDGSVMNGTEVDNSTVVDSNTTGGVLVNSTIDNSTLVNVTSNNSTVSDSNLTDVTLDSANVTNGTIHSGNISYGNSTYDADANGTANVTDVINFAPMAIFSMNPSSGNTDTTFSFNASNSSDINIGTLLNDSLTYSWDFGDGASASGAVVTHSYGSSARYTVILTVKDRFNLTSSFSRTFNVASVSDDDGNGGGSSGGGGDNTHNINIGSLSCSTKRVDGIKTNSMIKFKIDGENYKFRINSRSSARLKLRLVDTRESQTIPMGLTEEFSLADGRKLFVKYLEYSLSGSKMSVKLECVASTPSQNNQSGSGNVVIVGTNQTNNSITGGATTDVDKPKVWVGIVVGLGILVILLGGYLWFRYVLKRKEDI